MTPQEHIKELRAALQALVDVQNLPPQLAWKGDRQKAMAEAERLLAIEPAEKPKRYGCHCELGPGEKPDDCVMDTFPEDCVSATQLLRDGKTREDCPYWREVKEEG